MEVYRRAYSDLAPDSFAAAVKGNNQSNAPLFPTLNIPTLVLDDSCVNERDLSRHVMGRVKDLNSIPNLRTLLTKEGFPEVKLTYLGGMWVMIELDKENTKQKLLQHIGVNSWFQDLQVAKHDFVSDERVVGVDIEGIPLNVWTRETFLKIGKKWGEAMDIEENLDSSFARKRLCIKTKQPDNILEKFKVIFKGKVFMVRAKELFAWTPIFIEHKEFEYISDDESLQGAKNKLVGSQYGDDDLEDDSDVEGVSETIFGDNPSSPNNSFTPEVLEKRQENEHVAVDLHNDTDKETSPLVHAKVMNFSQESSIWCSILRETHILNSKGFDFGSHGKKRVGDGHTTRFWYDNWVSDQPFRVRFPRLFALETDKEASVASKLGSSSIDVTFRRSVRDGVERKQWTDLNSLSGEFRVKEVRIILDDIFLPSDTNATRWVKYIPIKVNVFAWRARLDRLPTRCNIIRRGVVLDSSLCPICSLFPEDIHHILFRCDIAQLVFRRICRWWDLDWHDLLSFLDWVAWFSAIRFPSSLKLILEGSFLHSLVASLGVQKPNYFCSESSETFCDF
ncbi:RNA-directed DNA polymerase, eukaryota, Reverse transcriptase zinc-binding domain protein [Artemisia annua]|uniref:RNA-directed DNA polymerase, eukaryota, Reverse transcriptase zinc-binding domain protein n=1 Tax=Artemisia annua TaxID=35608 RepID=A0A2U1NSA3_ARTAN|nr:RNA-directed DNA polymerase, eukaryota, Reverse transcriptase zinc-binding domain protein [Artemisia annua]